MNNTKEIVEPKKSNITENTLVKSIDILKEKCNGNKSTICSPTPRITSVVSLAVPNETPLFLNLSELVPKPNIYQYYNSNNDALLSKLRLKSILQAKQNKTIELIDLTLDDHLPSSKKAQIDLKLFFKKNI